MTGTFSATSAYTYYKHSFLGVTTKMSNYNYNCPTGVPMFPLYGYDNSEDMDMDMDYLKSMFPANIRRIQREIEDECDKLEYDGSCMFDAYPDKIHLSIIIDNVFHRVTDMDLQQHGVEAEDLSRRSNSFRPDLCPYGKCSPPGPRPDFDSHGRPDWLRNLLEVMFYNEMLHRRRRYRSRKRWF